ncbi:MAG TPA: phosphoglycerate kinase [Flavobacteriaceae bacterium]|nr:phosphoglycerate kinase [Flavobacteriaceae bacterium]MCB9211934.1 phosphoglycerate kinase [Alteromonas sp.]HPF09972.1 phosphoglycerate kinase [Flavobacteriaceae bacterium]HQU20069.1 phosphoglycerate kinase [Flavobacteriaceae bacterium]HQU63945.1 phosphoglycerate kinase [Flavobacteriaceae bacterium]
MKTIDQFNFNHKKALIRVDFNVPLNEQMQVTDTTRIEAAKPTIIKVLEDGGSCVLMSHLGRPKDRESEFSLKHVVGVASDILGVSVKFVDDCVGPEVAKELSQLLPGEIVLLENLRYHPEEEKGDVAFAKALSECGDIYVNDAFGTAHRAHASTTVVAQFFPETKCFGYLLASEIENVNKVLEDSQPPVTAIIGGAKVSSKITIIENILDKVDHLIIGGGMAFTFVKAQGGKIGNSLVEDDKQELALEILEKAKQKKVQVHLPSDSIIAEKFSNDSKTEVTEINQIPDGWMGLDVGPKTIESFSQVILASKTILFNGPVGVFEMPNFAKGTIAVCEAIAEATKNGAFSLVGGGDSVAAVKQFDFGDKVSYVSTGGGAMLEMLEGKTLPGIAAILE